MKFKEFEDGALHHKDLRHVREVSNKLLTSAHVQSGEVV